MTNDTRNNARNNNPLADMSLQDNLFSGDESQPESGRLQHAIRRRRSTTNPAEIEALNAEITALSAQLQTSLQVNGSHYKFRRFTMTKTSVTIPDELTEEEADEFGALIAGMGSAINWWMGAWANIYVTGITDDNKRGEIYEGLADHFGIEHSTLKNCASIDRKVSLRSDTLSWSHHVLVAPLSPAEQSQWLKRAEQGDGDGKRWSVARLRSEIKASTTPQLPEPTTSELLKSAHQQQSKRAESLIKQGISRESVAQMYEQIAQQIRNNQ